RDREASQQQIALMAANLDPELLAENRLVSDGAPVIGSDLVVESGNGRVLAIRRAYKTGAADEYKTWIADNAERFGLSSDEVAKVKQPVLVRERISDVDRVNFTSEANEASTARMSETETALNDAKKINQSMLTLFDPEKPIQSNRAFIQQFVSKVLQQNERGDFFQKNGEISKAGINRIENALIAKAYNNSTILNKLNEVYDDDIKNITNALLAAAPKIAVLENGAFRKDLSIRDDVVQAINALIEIKGEKGSVADYLSQIRIFDDDISNEAKTLLRFFDKNKRSSKKIAQGLINYAEDAMTESKDNQGALPGMEDSNRSKKDILRKAIKDAENGVNTKGESYNQSASSYHETDDDTKRKTLSHIRRTNDAFVTQEQVEKYYQDGNTWHGTGNIILGNVFKMQYIGSNEGSTYRGWGIYSGEAKGTGEAYRKYGEKGRGRSPFTFEMYVPDSPNVKLTTRADFEKYGLNPDIAEYIQEAAEVLFEDTEFSDSILETNKKILNTLVEYFNDEISILENEISDADTIEMSDEDISTREEGIKSYEDVIDFLTSPNIERISFKQTNGNLYRIKVHHVEAYLDYDNKLNEAGQPKIVLDAVKKIIDNLKKRGINTTELEQAKTGGDFYWVLTKAMEWLVDKGKIKSQKHGKITRADMAASLMLNHHGVPGLKFWDALSREKKSGTHNFVTWNEDAITVEGISEDSNEDAIDYFTQMQEKLANAPTKNIDISDDSDLAADSLIERYNQLAYHGTGHTLLGNMFDFDKLGSGEGNQAFGWGAYFAKKLAVAESY
ncbi:MAG: hypothetical protein IJR35_08825, partial [Synergistaceae bacterium]|nr:hypothetical protein [Synergistaceae bacterium]